MKNKEASNNTSTYFSRPFSSIQYKSGGYLLAVSLAVGLAITIIGITSINTITSGNADLKKQNYNRLADEAAKAGISAAIDCVQIQQISTWSTPLTPASDCTGSTLNSTKTTYVYQNSTQTLKSSYSVATPVVSGGATIITSTGTVVLGSTTVSTRVTHSINRDNVVTYKGYSQGTSTFTIPSHNAGDIIVVFMYCFSSAACTITTPVAGGTVPSWQTIDANPGVFYGSTYFAAMKVSYAIATANNHTSGTWTGGTGSVVAVLSGQSSTSPIGGHAEANGAGASNTSIQFPSITLADSSGTSQILAYSWSRAILFGTYNTSPTGYTFRLSGQNMFLTKDSTTSYSAFQLTNTGGSFSQPIHAAVVEVRAQPSSPFQY